MFPELAWLLGRLFAALEGSSLVITVKWRVSRYCYLAYILNWNGNVTIVDSY